MSYLLYLTHLKRLNIDYFCRQLNDNSDRLFGNHTLSDPPGLSRFVFECEWSKETCNQNPKTDYLLFARFQSV